MNDTSDHWKGQATGSDVVRALSLTLRANLVALGLTFQALRPASVSVSQIGGIRRPWIRFRGLLPGMGGSVYDKRGILFLDGRHHDV